MRKWSTQLFLSFLLLGSTLACQLIPEIGVPTPSASPTPLGDTLTLIEPLYNIPLEPGQTVPGTQLRFVDMKENTFDVTIDGLPAVKRSGDSFNWSGIIAAGIHGKYNLRLTTPLFGKLIAAGPVELTILNPTPIELESLIPSSSELHFGGITINYLVPEGGRIPGTTLFFKSGSEQGAELTGINGYPYFANGDSLVWSGTVQENTMIRYNLRVVNIETHGLRLVGTADLWINPKQ